MAFTFGKSAEEKMQLFLEIKELIEEKDYTLRELGEKYGVSKQALQQFLLRYNYSTKKVKDAVRKEVKQKVKKIQETTENETLLNYVERLRQEKIELQSTISNLKRRNKELMQQIEDDVRYLKLKDSFRKLRDRYVNTFNVMRYYKRKYGRDKEMIDN